MEPCGATSPTKSIGTIFPSNAQCRAIPYGVYGHGQKRRARLRRSHVRYTEVCHEQRSPMVATRGPINTIRMQAKLFIEADGGGSNGHRRRLWEYELQQFTNETGLTILVSHYPPGASKWNPIEHRLFGPISMNWRGRIRSLRFMLSAIRGTSNEGELSVSAEHDPAQIQNENQSE